MVNEKVAALLYEVYAAEIHAIGQYMDHHARCADLGYARLAEEFEQEAKDEMQHAEKVLERLLFLGAPVVSPPPSSGCSMGHSAPSRRGNRQ